MDIMNLVCSFCTKNILIFKNHRTLVVALACNTARQMYSAVRGTEQNVSSLRHNPVRRPNVDEQKESPVPVMRIPESSKACGFYGVTPALETLYRRQKDAVVRKLFEKVPTSEHVQVRAVSHLMQRYQHALVVQMGHLADLKEENANLEDEVDELQERLQAQIDKTCDVHTRKLIRDLANENEKLVQSERLLRRQLKCKSKNAEKVLKQANDVNRCIQTCKKCREYKKFLGSTDDSHYFKTWAIFL